MVFAIILFWVMAYSLTAVLVYAALAALWRRWRRPRGTPPPAPPEEPGAGPPAP